MLLLVLVCLLDTFVVARTVRVLDGEAYGRPPYTFGYNVHDEQGTKVHRLESADEAGVVKGEYGYIDAQGISRLVSYVADHNGYRASVSSNEPGVEAHSPASAVYQKHQTPGAYYSSQDGVVGGGGGSVQPVASTFAGFVPSPYGYAYQKARK